MLNQDIINEYLKNRDALNASWGNFNLFSPQASPGYTNQFIPQAYEPSMTMHPINAQAIAASPSLAGFDPGSFVSGTPNYDASNPVYSRGPMDIAMEYGRMGGTVGGMVQGLVDTFSGPQSFTSPSQQGIVDAGGGLIGVGNIGPSQFDASANLSDGGNWGWSVDF